MTDTAATRISPRAAAARRRAASPWSLYLIECRGGSIYTGIARDVAARYAAHCAGTGARYTRANPPFRLLAVLAFADQREASRAEWAVKRMTAWDKRELVLLLGSSKRNRLSLARRFIAAAIRVD